MSTTLNRALHRVAAGEPFSALGLNCLSALEEHYRLVNPPLCDLVRIEILARTSRL